MTMQLLILAALIVGFFPTLDPTAKSICLVIIAVLGLLVAVGVLPAGLK